MLRTAGRIQKYMKAANSLWPESLICWAFFFDCYFSMGNSEQLFAN